jgi:hypothetical protein
MKMRAPSVLRRSILLAVFGVLIALVAACTGRGGGQLPPSVGFTGQASLGFDFSCEDSGGINPQTGQLRIQQSYTDHGTSVFDTGQIGSFSIHGIVDQIDPVLESMICIGDTRPDPNELIFLGRYYLTSSAPAGFKTECAKRETETPLCRFEVIVRDNDMNRAPSPGDFFSIKLSSGTAVTSELDPATVFYARAGLLSAGNLTVD